MHTYQFHAITLLIIEKYLLELFYGNNLRQNKHDYFK